MQDDASSLSPKPVVSPGVFPQSSAPNHVSLGWTEAFEPRADIETFGLLPSGSRGMVDQDQVARPVDFSLPQDEVVEVDDYFELSPYGLRGACPRQPVAPLMGASAHIVATTPRSRALGFGATSLLSSAPGTTSSEVVGAFPREIPASENRMGRSPILYVQLQIGTNIPPALVDSGACDNFMSAQTVAKCTSKFNTCGKQRVFCPPMASPLNVRLTWSSPLSLGPCRFH